jgi:hypothetical protein
MPETTNADIDNMIAKIQSDLDRANGAPSDIATTEEKSDLSGFVDNAVTLLQGLKTTPRTAEFTPGWNMIMAETFPQMTELMSRILTDLDRSAGLATADNEIGCCQYGDGGLIQCTRGTCTGLLGTWTPGPCE